MDGELERRPPQDAAQQADKTSPENVANQLLVLFEGEKTTEEIITVLINSGFPKELIFSLGSSLMDMLESVRKKLSAVSELEGDVKAAVFESARKQVRSFFEANTLAIERYSKVKEEPLDYATALAAELSYGNLHELSQDQLISFSETVAKIAEAGEQRLLYAICLKMKAEIEQKGYGVSEEIVLEKRSAGGWDADITVTSLRPEGKFESQQRESIRSVMDIILGQLKAQFPGLIIYVRAAGDNFITVSLPWHFKRDK